MKRLLSFVIAIEVLGLVTACQTTSTGGNTASQKETLLLQVGFKPRTVTTPKQQERVSALPEGKVSAVKFKGRTYHVYPTATKDRILCGTQAQFDAYKQSLQQRSQLTGPIFEEELRGPYPMLELMKNAVGIQRLKQLSRPDLAEFYCEGLAYSAIGPDRIL